MTEPTKVLSNESKPQRKFNKGPKGKKPVKKGGKKLLPKVKRGDPVFAYTSVCCGVRADKSPCERKPEDRAEGKFSDSPLGTWKCPACHKKCKVTRGKNKVEEVAPVKETGNEQEVT